MTSKTINCAALTLLTFVAILLLAQAAPAPPIHPVVRQETTPKCFYSMSTPSPSPANSASAQMQTASSPTATPVASMSSAVNTPSSSAVSTPSSSAVSTPSSSTAKETKIPAVSPFVMASTPSSSPTLPSVAPSPTPNVTPLTPSSSASPPAAMKNSTNSPTSSLSCPPGAFFCENFESLSDASMSVKWKLEGAAVVDAVKARGSRALHLTPTGGRFGRLVVNGFSPPAKSFYGRMYTYVESFATAPSYAHFVMAEVSSSKSGTERVRPIGGQYIPNVGSLWGVGSDGGPSGDWTSWQKTAPTTDAVWTCLEWRMDGTDNNVDVWIDGVSKPELSVSTKKNGSQKDFFFPKFDSIWFGWWVFQGDTNPAKFNAHIDDIVLSTSRVGCK